MTLFLNASYVRAELINISTLDGTFGADATVRPGNTAGEALNYGKSAYLEVSTSSSTGELNLINKAYLRFDLSSVVNTVLSQVSLTLNFERLRDSVGEVMTGGRSFNLYGLLPNSNSPTSHWAEGEGGRNGSFPDTSAEITWDNAPGNDIASSSGFDANTVLLGVFTVNQEGIAEINDSVLTEGLGLNDYFAQGHGSSATLMISGYDEISSRNEVTRITSGQGEGSSVPRLSFSTGGAHASPEPGTMILLGVSGAGYALYASVKRFARREPITQTSKA